MDVEKKFTILLVEDNDADADLVSEMIQERLKCGIIVAKDGEQAIKIVKESGEKGGVLPDLILLDLNLPKVSGMEVLKAVKSDADSRRIPVLIFTSSGAERDILACYDLNANCYIQKPSDLNRYMNVIDNLNSFWIEKVKLPPKDWRRKNG